MIDERIIIRANAFWPEKPLTAQAVKAWAHLLKRLPPEQVLNALDEYACEGHTFPPMAGQLYARSMPQDKESKRETEANRCRRQRKTAKARLAAGKMSREDYDYYQRTYWGKHIGGDRD